MQEKKEKFNKLKYNENYNKKNYKDYKLRLHKKDDKDIIEALEKEKSKNSFIKKCIKKEIEKNK